MESSIVSEARMKILKDTVEHIFHDRFDMPLEAVSYTHLSCVRGEAIPVHMRQVWHLEIIRWRRFSVRKNL